MGDTIHRPQTRTLAPVSVRRLNFSTTLSPTIASSLSLLDDAIDTVGIPGESMSKVTLPLTLASLDGTVTSGRLFPDRSAALIVKPTKPSVSPETSVYVHVHDVPAESATHQQQEQRPWHHLHRERASGQ